MIFLETKRLLFREHQASDEAEFVRMHTDPEVRRYVGGAAWPLAKAKGRFREQYLGHPTKTYGLWAMVWKEDETYIGSCGLRTGRNETEAHLGYYVARPYWRRGVATEASKAFIKVAFDGLGLRSVLAEVELGNIPSEHILKKLGFKYASREEIAASGRVICGYELSRDDWEKRAAG